MTRTLAEETIIAGQPIFHCSMNIWRKRIRFLIGRNSNALVNIFVVLFLKKCLNFSMLYHSKHHRCTHVSIQLPLQVASFSRGVNVGEIDLKKLRESISLVPQAEDLDGFNFGL